MKQSWLIINVIFMLFLGKLHKFLSIAGNIFAIDLSWIVSEYIWIAPDKLRLIIIPKNSSSILTSFISFKYIIAFKDYGTYCREYCRAQVVDSSSIQLSSVWEKGRVYESNFENWVNKEYPSLASTARGLASIEYRVLNLYIGCFKNHEITKNS